MSLCGVWYLLLLMILFLLASFTILQTVKQKTLHIYVSC